MANLAESPPGRRRGVMAARPKSMTQQGDMSMTLNVTETADAAVVRVVGSAGIVEADRIRETLNELVAREVPVIVMDLAGMDFVTSSVLGAMIDAHVHSREYHGRLRLVNPQPGVMSVLQTTNLTSLFEICPSVEKASMP